MNRPTLSILEAHLLILKFNFILEKQLNNEYSPHGHTNKKNKDKMVHLPHDGRFVHYET